MAPLTNPQRACLLEGSKCMAGASGKSVERFRSALHNALAGTKLSAPRLCKTLAPLNRPISKSDEDLISDLIHQIGNSLDADLKDVATVWEIFLYQ